MMTFYSAIGWYRIRTIDGHKVPFIQKLGKLHRISIPEFVIWSTLLWEVLTYDELRKEYELQMDWLDHAAPDFDEMLEIMIKRKLITKGIGYTGTDALYNMFSDAFVVPAGVSGCRKVFRVLGLVLRGKLSLSRAVQALKREKHTNDENDVLNLVEQTPLSTAELVRCFDRCITDVHTSEKVMDAIYSDEGASQAHIGNEEFCSVARNRVLVAVSNLYLQRKIVFELP